MQIIENTNTRLVLQRKRPVMAAVMGLFTLMSGLALVNLFIQGVPRIEQLNFFQLVSWLVWLLLALAMVSVGVMATINMARGITCIFDKDSETFAIWRPHFMGMQTTEHSIWGIKRVDVIRNDEMRLLALFVILRSNEKIPLTTMPQHDEGAIYELANTIRAFLWT